MVGDFINVNVKRQFASLSKNLIYSLASFATLEKMCLWCGSCTDRMVLVPLSILQKLA